MSRHGKIPIIFMPTPVVTENINIVMTGTRYVLTSII